MKEVFTTSRSTVAALIGIIFLLVVSPVIVYIFFTDGHESVHLIAVGLIYAAYSPLILLLSGLVRRYSSGKIIIDDIGIFLFSGKEHYSSGWRGVEHVFFDLVVFSRRGRSAGRNYLLYEIAADNFKARFFTVPGKNDPAVKEGPGRIESLSRKAFRHELYGIYLGRKDSEKLLRYIADYSGLIPERKRGLF